MNITNSIYKSLLHTVRETGELVSTRNHEVKRSFLLPNTTFTETPLVTVRKTAWKLALLEMEYFLNGKTHLDDLDVKVHPWWEYSCTITPRKMHYSYGAALRNVYTRSTEVVKIPKRDYKDTYIEKTIPRVSIDSLENVGKLTGKTFKLRDNSDTVVVLDIVGKRKTNSIYKVQFGINGYIAEYRDDVIQKGNMKNPYVPSIYGVGYLGEPYEHPAYKKGLQVWYHMLGRCYDVTNSNYKSYGGRGIFVSKRWHNFANFLNDLAKLPGYENWFKDSTTYHLDKDYYGSSIYSEATCIFLPREQNTLYSKSKGKYILEKGTTRLEFLSECSIATHLGISRTAVRNNSRTLSSTGYKISFQPNTTEYKYRFKIIVDQIADLLANLKEHPNSRRLLTTTWIPEHVQSGWMNPTNCHGTLTQFFVSKGKLHMKTYQRSADMLLGVPHNWIQSWAFLLYLAYHSGLKVGSLTWMWGDSHIYQEESHLRISNEIIDEEESIFHHNPQLVYRPTDLQYDWNNVPIFKAEDFFMEGVIDKPVVVGRPKLL